MLFTSKSLPNTHVEIINSQFWLRVSLNISPELVGYLSKGNVRKANKLFIFVISARIKGQISAEKMNAAYSNCMKTAMSKVREAKMLKIKNELRLIPLMQYNLFDKKQ